LPPLRADGRAVRQILINLISNALKFTPQGGSVRVASWGNDRGRLCLSVTDTGIGMKPEDIPRAMEPFIQLENHMSKKHQGAGLGLSIVNSLARLHGGVLDVASEPGKGSTFTVRFPAERSARAAAA
jgi:signal transduction histidine kinase